jgi:predicted O-methyltransferase YrrM
MAHFVLWSVGMAEAETQTTLEERQCLAHYAAGRRRLVEIGVWHGVTTSLLRRVMASDGELFAVDPFPIGRLGFSMQAHIAHKEVARVLNGTVRWMRLTGAEAGRRFAEAEEKAVDFLFIDADHSYAGLRDDWEGWSSLMGTGGIAALHDSHPTPQRPISDSGSVKFTQEVVLRDSRFELIEIVDSLSVLRRRPHLG